MEVLSTYHRMRAPAQTLPTALGASVVLHVLLLLIFRFGAVLVPSTPPELPEQTIRISLAPPDPSQIVDKKTEQPANIQVPARQIVSTPDSPEAEPTVATRLLAERSTRAEVEQVKRGEGGGEQGQKPVTQQDQKVSPIEKPVEKPVKRPEPKVAQSKPSSEKPHSSITPQDEAEPMQTATHDADAPGILRLSERTLQSRVLANPQQTAARSQSSESSGPVAKAPSDQKRQIQLSSYKPFSGRAAGVGAGLPGIPDYLPQVRDGDITLLNAKADKYAVFVRRVALQVFGALRSSQWREVPYSEVARMNDLVSVKATLSPDGKLLRVEIMESSGSLSFDQAVKGAVQKGAWDQNPPPDAVAANGNIEFLFKSRTWARRSPDRIGEQRWLLLATGLL